MDALAFNGTALMHRLNFLGMTESKMFMINGEMDPI